MNKSKVAMTVVVVVMALAIVGLTIGLILTAAQLSVQNSMNVTYSVEDVKAKISATGKYYKTDSVTYANATTINASNTSVSVDATVKDEAVLEGVAFVDQALGPNGYAVYMFAIKNDASVGGNNMNVAINLKKLVTVTVGEEEQKQQQDIVEADNIKTVILASTATTEEAAYNEVMTDIAEATASTALTDQTVTASNTTYFAIVISVDDNTLKADVNVIAIVSLTDIPVA